jgi:hypothetical protein
MRSRPTGDGGRVQGFATCGSNSAADQLRPLDHEVRPSLELPPTTPGQPPSRVTGQRQLWMHWHWHWHWHWRCRRSAFAPRCGLRTALSIRNEHSIKYMPTPPLCPSCDQNMRLARITSRFGDLPDFISLNAELVACQKSRRRIIEAA